MVGPIIDPLVNSIVHTHVMFEKPSLFYRPNAHFPYGTTFCPCCGRPAALNFLASFLKVFLLQLIKIFLATITIFIFLFSFIGGMILF